MFTAIVLVCSSYMNDCITYTNASFFETYEECQAAIFNAEIEGQFYYWDDTQGESWQAVDWDCVNWEAERT